MLTSILVFTLLAARPDKAIVIQEGIPAQVTVESGTSTISGSPENSIKAAYRQWQAECTSWKNEIKALNGKNLIYISCGQAKRVEERQASERLLVYRSEGSFKIRVSSR